MSEKGRCFVRNWFPVYICFPCEMPDLGGVLIKRLTLVMGMSKLEVRIVWFCGPGFNAENAWDYKGSNEKETSPECTLTWISFRFKFGELGSLLLLQNGNA